MADNKFGTVYVLVCHSTEEDFIVQIYASLQLAMEDKKRIEAEDMKLGYVDWLYSIESHPVICK